MENEFLKHPISLDILGTDLEQESFYPKQTLIFLGDVPTEILAKISKNSLESDKTLEAYYGKNFAKILGSQEDDIFDITPDILENSPNKPEIEKELKELARKKTKIAEKKEESVEKIKYITDVHIYPEDRISEFKEKIYLSTNIPIYKQHLFAEVNGQIIPMRYKITVDGIINVDIKKIFQGSLNNKILNIPVDQTLFQNREYY